MFGTVLRDVFASGERAEMRNAINELCAPTDTYGWASVGVYAFFDPEPKDLSLPPLLYIGLANDLSDRFAKHAGLKGSNPAGSKLAEINAWFDGHTSLGYSCVVQSALAQVGTYRQRAAKSSGEHPEYGLASAKLIEGQLIETYRIAMGVRPPWNENAGSAQGTEAAADGSLEALLPLLDGRQDSLFVARRTIRELASDATSTHFESDLLHLARTTALSRAVDTGARDEDILAELNQLAVNPLYQGFGLEDNIGKLVASGYIADLSLPTDEAANGEFEETS